MKKALLLLSTLPCLTLSAQDNSIRDGGEYIIYNTYYNRCLGTNEAKNGPALSPFGTNDSIDYVWVAEASTLHEGYYWLRKKSSNQYLQASNDPKNTWGVWLAGSLNKAYNSYEWKPTGGTASKIISNRGEQINADGNVYLGTDPDKETNTFVNVYYDKPFSDRSTWQIVDANFPLNAGRLKLYTDEIGTIIQQGENIYNNDIYGKPEELQVALYNARSAVETASLDNIEELLTAQTALKAAIENAQEGNYITWISGNSFGTHSAFTVALKSVKFCDEMAEGEATMIIRNLSGTGATVAMSQTYVRIEDKTFTATETENGINDWQFAFDGENVTVYCNGTALGTAPQKKVAALTSAGTSAEWTIFGINALESYTPEIISYYFAYKPGEGTVEKGKMNPAAIKLVGSNVVLDTAVDYHILAANNAMTNSTINLTSPDSWIIFENVRPSDVISQYLPSIKINGKAAKDNYNCRVAIYLQGAVVYPYSANDIALYGYSGEMFSGNEYTFKLGENSSMGDATNELNSFILKRGYMVCLSTNSDGSGYSRIYVADHEDKKIDVLPDLLKNRISRAFIRKWNWVSKKGWCSTEGQGAINAEGKQLGTTWYYTWSADKSTQTDMEYVPMQGHLYWPSLSSLNQSNATCLLSFNEPDHSEQHSDDCGKTISEWTACTKMPSYQASGLRIGSPSPTDDGWLKNFIGHCDDMSYRVDFVAFHAYWGTNEASNSDAWWSKLNSIYKSTGRPIWLTEWNNGASWTTESWPSSYGDKLTKQKNAIKSILSVLDNADFIERYALYNWDTYYRAAITWDGDKNSWWVTPCGEVYRDTHPSHAYKESMQKVPVGWFPGIKKDNSITFTVKSAGRTFNPTIINNNGDFTLKEEIEYLDQETKAWKLFYDNSAGRSKFDSTAERTSSLKLDNTDIEALTTPTLTLRLHITTLNGGETYTDAVTADVPSYIVNYYTNKITGISTPVATEESIDAVYSPSGTESGTLKKGINIIRNADGTSRKVLIK